MTIKKVSIELIRPYESNAKKHPDKQVKQIADSIAKFGFNQPLVVDKDNVIIVGHGRYLAAALLGLSEVPVMQVNIAEDEAAAYRLADNKLNESAWDMDLVIAELKTLDTDLLNLTGFSAKLVLENDDNDDHVPSTPPEARTHLGDVYELGHHKLVCGDSTKPEDFQKLLGPTKADCVFTDPPYNVDYKGDGKNTKEGIMNDKMSPEKFRVFLDGVFSSLRTVVKGGGGLYIFHSTSTQKDFEDALIKNGFDIRNQLIWNKPTASMGWGDYRWKHEPFFYASVKGQSPNFYGDRTNTTIIDFHKTEAQLLAWAKQQKKAEKDGKTTIWTMKREPVTEYVHPTQKPVELITYALYNSSKTDDIVLDPFLGSGSTIIACQKTNRICFGLELDPKFCDVIVQRYVDFTDNKEIIKNGKTITW